MAPDPSRNGSKFPDESTPSSSSSDKDGRLVKGNHPPMFESSRNKIKGYIKGIRSFFSSPYGPGGSSQDYSRVATEDDLDDSNYNKLPAATYIDSLEDDYEKDVVDSNENNRINKDAPQYTTLEYCIGWISMALAILAGASIGPVFRYMLTYGVTPLLAASWRCQAMVVCLAPAALWEIYATRSKPIRWFHKPSDLPFSIGVHLLTAGFAWAFNLLFWIVSLRYISTFKASILATCHPIILVFWLRCSGKVVSYAEWFGVFISFFGVFVSNGSSLYKELYGDGNSHTNMNGSGSTEMHGGENMTEELENVPLHLQFLGIVFCLLAALGECVVIVNRIKTRKYVPLLQVS
jgi:drug/metabolite transporter (DMT)-like permease